MLNFMDLARSGDQVKGILVLLLLSLDFLPGAELSFKLPTNRLRRRKILGHGRPQSLEGVSNLPTNAIMRLNSCIFADNLLPAKPPFRLRDPKEISALPHGKSSFVRFKHLSSSDSELVFPPRHNVAHRLWSRRGTWSTLKRKRKIFHEANRGRSLSSPNRSPAALLQRRGA